MTYSAQRVASFQLQRYTLPRARSHRCCGAEGGLSRSLARLATAAQRVANEWRALRGGSSRPHRAPHLRGPLKSSSQSTPRTPWRTRGRGEAHHESMFRLSQYDCKSHMICHCDPQPGATRCLIMRPKVGCGHDIQDSEFIPCASSKPIVFVSILGARVIPFQSRGPVQCAWNCQSVTLCGACSLHRSERGTERHNTSNQFIVLLRICSPLSTSTHIDRPRTQPPRHLKRPSLRSDGYK